MATHDGDVPPRGATDYAAYTMDDIAAMTQDELRDALVAATTRNTALTSENEALMAKNSVLEDVLKIERARYVCLTNNHPLMRERSWLKRAFCTCSAQHRGFIALAMVM